MRFTKRERVSLCSATIFSRTARSPALCFASVVQKSPPTRMTIVSLSLSLSFFFASMTFGSSKAAFGMPAALVISSSALFHRNARGAARAGRAERREENNFRGQRTRMKGGLFTRPVHPASGIAEFCGGPDCARRMFNLNPWTNRGRETAKLRPLSQNRFAVTSSDTTESNHYVPCGGNVIRALRTPKSQYPCNIATRPRGVSVWRARACYTGYTTNKFVN